MKNRVTQNNRYQEKSAGTGFPIKGDHIVRILVGLLLVLSLALVYAILYSSHGLPGYRKQSEQVRELEEKILKLKTENQKLFETIQALKSSPQAQEKLVRQELGWVRENEIILETPEKDGQNGEKPAPPLRPLKPAK
jgi:cell division protein FtsB